MRKTESSKIKTLTVNLHEDGTITTYGGDTIGRLDEHVDFKVVRNAGYYRPYSKIPHDDILLISERFENISKGHCPHNAGHTTIDGCVTNELNTIAGVLELTTALRLHKKWLEKPWKTIEQQARRLAKKG